MYTLCSQMYTLMYILRYQVLKGSQKYTKSNFELLTGLKYAKKYILYPKPVEPVLSDNASFWLVGKIHLDPIFSMIDNTDFINHSLFEQSKANYWSLCHEMIENLVKML